MCSLKHTPCDHIATCRCLGAALPLSSSRLKSYPTLQQAAAGSFSGKAQITCLISPRTLRNKDRGWAKQKMPGLPTQPRGPWEHSKIYRIQLVTPTWLQGGSVRYVISSQNLFTAANLQFELHVENFILMVYQEFHCPFPGELISRKDLQDLVEWAPYIKSFAVTFVWLIETD